MAQLSAARKAALSTLLAARERTAYVRELLNSPTSAPHLAALSPEDRAFAARLALGVTSTQGTLDEAIDAHLRPGRPLDPEVRDALRVSAYEILFLGKSPFAAVSQGVELVRSRAKSASGLANAVLRRVAEGRDAFMAASEAHRFGMPSWLVEYVRADLGDAGLERLGEAGLAQAPTYVANNPAWMGDSRAREGFAAAGVSVEKHGSVPGAWLASDARSVASCALFSGEEVQAVVADYGAQLTAYLAAPAPGERVLEVGSGRGTKTILLAGHAHRAHGAARIWALDVHAGKAKVASDRLARARVEGVTQVVGDAREPEVLDELPPQLDCVLVDAPCTGTGTLRRHPEITWSLLPEDVSSCARLQLQILRSVGPRVAPGGRLAYATCSVLRAEDEDVVAAFLASPEGEGFEVVRASDVARDDDAAEELAGLETTEGFMRTTPVPQGPDGHFCAVLRRSA